MRQVQRMAQNPSFPWVPSESPGEPEYRNESPQRQRLRAVFSAFQESGAGSGLALDILLHELTEESLAISGVTGSAIALRDTGDHFVCRAVAGEPTPALGARIEAQDGLSAECVRTGRLQVCQDTESDARLNAEMCRAWGVRSLAIVPLFLRQRLIGILEAFSPISGAFDRTAIARLVQLGNYVVETVAFSEGPLQPEPVIPPKPAASFRPRVETRVETWIDTQLPEVPPTPVVAPMKNAEMKAAERKNADLETVFMDVEHSVPEIHSESMHSEAEQHPVTDSQFAAMTLSQPDASKPSFSEPGVFAAPSRGRNLGLALIALAAGFIAVVGLWSWWPSADNRPVSASVIASQVPRGTDSANPGGPKSTERHLSSRAAKPSPSSSSFSRTPSPTVAKSTGDLSPRTGGLVVYEKGKVVYRALPGSVSMIGPATTGSATNTPATGPGPGAPAALTPSEPSTAIASSSTSGLLTTGPVTSAAETEKLRDTADVASSITGGKLIHQVDPVMPPEVAGLNLPKEVLLEGVIDRDGSVRDIRLLRGDARLSAAAIEAVRQWRYEPFRSNGERVDMLATLSVRFR
jgi:TonB family protein